LGFVTYPLSAEYWASKGSTKYHYPTCKRAQKIAPRNLIQFSSPEQAIKGGYVPCKLCKPPGS
jgi:methylphosphotriester-DNA--protein-cysteine methyltransferase